MSGTTTKFDAKTLSTDEKLDVIIQALVEISGQLEDHDEMFGEIVEKISNLTLDNEGFGVDKFDS